MADVNKNTGNALKFKDGTIEISGGTDQYILLQRVHGTLTFTEGGFGVIPISENGSLDETNIRQGDEKPTSVEIQFEHTKLGMTGTNDLYDLVKPSHTNGIRDTFEMIVEIPDYLGASTGLRYTFAFCYTNEGGIRIDTGGDDETDKVSLSITDMESAPTKAAYS